MGTKLSDFIPFLNEYVSKLLLSIIRIVAITFLGYWIKKSLKEKSSNSFYLHLALFLLEQLVIYWIPFFMEPSFRIAMEKLLLFFLIKAMRRFFLATLLTCSNSQLYLGYGQNGFLLLEENPIHFLNMFLILLTPQLVSE